MSHRVTSVDPQLPCWGCAHSRGAGESFPSGPSGERPCCFCVRNPEADPTVLGDPEGRGVWYDGTPARKTPMDCYVATDRLMDAAAKASPADQPKHHNVHQEVAVGLEACGCASILVAGPPSEETLTDLGELMLRDGTLRRMPLSEASVLMWLTNCPHGDSSMSRETEGFAELEDEQGEA